MSSLRKSDDTTIAKAFVKAVAGKGVREVKKLTGVGRQTVSNWRRAVRLGQPVKMDEATREPALRYLEQIPAERSPSYADGMRFVLDRVRENLTGTLGELEEILARAEAEAAATPPAGSASDPNPQEARSNGSADLAKAAQALQKGREPRPRTRRRSGGGDE